MTRMLANLIFERASFPVGQASDQNELRSIRWKVFSSMIMKRLSEPGFDIVDAALEESIDRLQNYHAKHSKGKYSAIAITDSDRIVITDCVDQVLGESKKLRAI